jgi:hypothetical protein
MLGKKRQQIKELKHELEALQWDMYEVQASTADPDMKSYHLGELQCVQMAIEEEIEALEHDLAMLPLRLMLGGFIVFTVGLFIYYSQKL